MKIGKYNFNREMPRIVIEKRILSIFNPRIRRKWECRVEGELGIGITNICNLKCFSCVSLCDTPLGSNTFRKERYELECDELDLFLERIPGYLPKRWVTFTGGEVTAIEPSKLEELAVIAHRHKRKVLLISNGFRLDKVDPFFFDYIRLDSHGSSNIEDIERSVQYLKKSGYIFFEVVETLVHQDFHKALDEKIITEGLKCPIWMGVSLWGKTVYPCCCLAQLDGFLNVTTIKDALDEAGWNIENPDLQDVIDNWMETVPAVVVKMCTLECWRGREAYDERTL